jgi:ATP-dependent Clp protease ATP-binding subunit ClpC
MFYDRFSSKASELFLLSQKEAELLGHPEIDSEHFLLALLKDPTNEICVLLKNQYDIDYDRMKNEIVNFVGTGFAQRPSPQPSAKLRKILEKAYEEVRLLNIQHIEVEHILLAILQERQNLVIKILNQLNVEPEVLVKEFEERLDTNYQDDRQAKQTKNDYIFKQLEEFGVNLNEYALKGKLDPVICRENEIERIMQVLARRKKNNPVLIGEPGVGKTAIVEGLTQRIVAQQVPENLKNRVIFSLDIASLVAGTKYRGEFEKRLKKLLLYLVQEPNIIVFIDEIHTIVGAGAAEGAVDAANILKPALSRGEFRCIGATTPDEYRKYIEKDGGLERRFQKLYIQEPTVEDTLEILKGLRSRYETHHKVRYTDEALQESVRLSRTYISEHFLPDMAIDVIDEAGARKRLKTLMIPPELKQKEEKIEEIKRQRNQATLEKNFMFMKKLMMDEREMVLEYNREFQQWKNRIESSVEVVDHDDVAIVVSNWTGIPLTRLEESEVSKLLNIESILHERVVGQNEAIEAVAKAIRRTRSGLKDPRRPSGTFLFLGPTGVGKTELAKTLSEALFGNEKSLVRFDMSEYMERFALSRLIGAPPGYIGYDEGGSLTEVIRRKPYSVILFDEIEKAHPDVYNILLQIMDEGRLTDSGGRNVDFRNTILIMTSNIGGEIINRSKNTVGFGIAESEEEAYEDMKRTVIDEVKKVFRPEFLNRLDEIIVFHQLTREHIYSVVDIMISDLEKRLASKNITFELKQPVKDYLVDKGFDKQFGARPLKRAIQRYIEDPLSEEILKKQIESGNVVIIFMNAKGEVIFKRKREKEIQKPELISSESIG